VGAGVARFIQIQLSNSPRSQRFAPGSHWVPGHPHSIFPKEGRQSAERRRSHTIIEGVGARTIDEGAGGRRAKASGTPSGEDVRAFSGENTLRLPALHRG